MNKTIGHYLIILFGLYLMIGWVVREVLTDTVKDSKAEEVSTVGSRVAYRVIDGDTIELNNVEYFNGEHIYGRLACIDAPETGQNAWGLEATKRLRVLLEESTLIEIEHLKKDHYGRAIVLIKNGESELRGNIQRELVKEGLAYVYHTYKKDCPIYDDLVELENNAKSLRKGVWSNKESIPPWDYRKNQVHTR